MANGNDKIHYSTWLLTLFIDYHEFDNVGIITDTALADLDPSLFVALPRLAVVEGENIQLFNPRLLLNIFDIYLTF